MDLQPRKQLRTMQAMRCIGFIFILLFSQACAADCIKQVFNHYCLGGVATLPDTALISSQGKQSHWRFMDDNKWIDVIAVAGRITRIMREEPPGSWLNFLDWKQQLIAIYGRGQDFSLFPKSAASRSARLNAVTTGKGYALMQWQQPQWQLNLRWDHPQFIRLEYTLNDDSQPSPNDSGL